jgi:hypothetical protein
MAFLLLAISTGWVNLAIQYDRRYAEKPFFLQ